MGGNRGRGLPAFGLGAFVRIGVSGDRCPEQRPGSSAVERSPEKAGVGGSIPSLATIESASYSSTPKFRASLDSKLPLYLS